MCSAFVNNQEPSVKIALHYINVSTGGGEIVSPTLRTRFTPQKMFMVLISIEG
jgi:hypothetical protein